MTLTEGIPDHFEEFKRGGGIPDSGYENPGDEIPSNKNFDHLPTFLRDLFTKGTQEPIDFNVSLSDRPKWLDVEKFKRGQKFAVDSLIGASIADVLSVFLMFSLKPALLPLMFTGCTDTPVKCYRRYLFTFLKVTSWYKEDMWGDKSNTAKSNLEFVKSTHKRAFEKINNCPENEFDKKISLTVKNPNFKFVCKNAISEDIKKISPYPYVDTNKKEGDLWMSQASMSLTQFTFVGLLVTYPKSFGIFNATEKNFEDLIHMWKGLGFLLGIKDEYNFCKGGLNAVRQRTKDLIEYISKPSLKNLTDDWEHMSRCIVDGSRFYTGDILNFESNLLLLFHILKMDMPRFSSLVSIYKRLIFYGLRFLIFFLLRISFVTTWLRNWLDRRMKYIATASSEVWAEWEEREFPYIEKKIRK